MDNPYAFTQKELKEIANSPNKYPIDPNKPLFVTIEEAYKEVLGISEKEFLKAAGEYMLPRIGSGSGLRYSRTLLIILSFKMAASAATFGN